MKGQEKDENHDGFKHTILIYCRIVILKPKSRRKNWARDKVIDREKLIYKLRIAI
jgi:hypothetical protein